MIAHSMLHTLLYEINTRPARELPENISMAKITNQGHGGIHRSSSHQCHTVLCVFHFCLIYPSNKHESQHITQNLRVVKKIWIFPGHVSKYTTVFNLDEDVVSLSVVTICSRDFSNDASNVLHHLTWMQTCS